MKPVPFLWWEISRKNIPVIVKVGKTAQMRMRSVRSRSLAIRMAVVVMKATILHGVTHRGSGAQWEWDGEAHLHWYFAGAHHLCLWGLSGRAQIAGDGNGTAPFLHYEVVKEVGSDFYWCLLFSASNQNQFILLDRILYKKVEERQPKDMQSILLRIFPW